MPTPYPPPKDGSHHPDPDPGPLGVFFTLAAIMLLIYLGIWFFLL